MQIFCISTAPNRKAKQWREEALTWAQLKQRCGEVKRTDETVAEFSAMSPEKQSDIKDVGGFVGGKLADGKRDKSSVLSRSLVTLDADFADDRLLETFKKSWPGVAAICYSTHKHTTERPRLRLVIPLNRDVTPDEYEPISRRIAERIGIEYFDHTTHDINRLFFWPSASSDGAFYYNVALGKPLDVDDVLATYKDYHDVCEWPMASKENRIISKLAKKVGDPTEKTGFIGAFCRAYTVPEAIEAFLSDVYRPAESSDRYAYIKGSTSGGAVIYPYNDKVKDAFMYSHHESDPVSGRLCNAFDLVRLHKYGHLDADAKPNTPVDRLPSYIAMQDLCRGDKKVCAEVRARADHDFDGIDFQTLNADGTVANDVEQWADNLSLDRKGRIEKNLKNIYLIIMNDERIKTRYNLFTCHDIAEGPYLTDAAGPREVDDEILGKIAEYIESTYGLSLTVKKIDEALTATRTARGLDPVKDFITAEQWDSTERVKTLLVDYLGADDRSEIRELTKRWMIAAVMRVYKPGTTFQNVLTLIGPQGTGKSTFLKYLAGGPDYFTDNLDVGALDKERREATQGKWIIELSDLTGLSRADWQSLKSYISRDVDSGRAAYARRPENAKRRFVFAATTNDAGFLRDSDKGNRRWWVIDCPGIKRDWRQELRDNVPQIWAEAYHYYKTGESVELSDATRAYIEAEQFNHSEDADDPLPGQIDEYLDTLLPEDWDLWTNARRRSYYKDLDPLEVVGRVRRNEFCAVAFLSEYPLKGFYAQGKALSRKINAYMNTKNNWASVYKRFSGYGLQRGFARDLTPHDADNL